jgi:7-cyano-7-deazaguanine synthase
MVIEGPKSGQEAAVLCSGGLDSIVLLADEATRNPVLPVYIRVGLAWEAEEEACLERILASSPFAGSVHPLVTLDATVRDLYPSNHWAIRGTPPDYDTADEEVYLIGRNVMLIPKAAILCAQREISRLVLGSLAANPFPDATPEFFDSMARAVSLGLAHRLEIATPFATVHKASVIARGLALGVDVSQTLSCMNPKGGMHCGQCSKCRERRDAFVEAGVVDRTAYAGPSPR